MLSRHAPLRVPMAALVLPWLIASGPDARGETPRPHLSDERQGVQEDTQPLRLSLPTQQDRDAWRGPGFRVQLGYAYGKLGGRRGAPDFTARQVVLRPQVRIDPWWSVAVTATYGLAGGGLDGLHWDVTVEPTLHPAGGLGLSLGLGYAGILGSRTSRPPPGDDMRSCDGGGWIALGRVEYLFIVGPLFATGPFARVGTRWVACTQPFDLPDPTNGQRLSGHRWWQYHGYSLGWGASWR